MATSLPPRKLEVFELLDLLDSSAQLPVSPAIDALGEAQPTPSSRASGSGRVFRVKLGYNPNSSSLGTSVVTLVWGVGLAGIVFQWVGSWLLASDGPGGMALLPPSSAPDQSETDAGESP